jgi:hypothetical protein
MLVFGDAGVRVAPRARLAEIAGATEALPAGADGQRSFWDLTEVFLDAAGLAQGLIDAVCAAAGRDADSALRAAAMGLVMAAARALAALWVDSNAPIDPAGIGQAAVALAALPLPSEVECRRPEGYAFYAVYPEAYLAAAAALPDRPVRAIGIRSIGLGLAALVAAARNAPPPATVRPIGHPFHRSLALAPGFRSRLVGPAGTVSAIADEGPGLSGSSFSAVIDTLEAAGVPEESIHLFPSHAGAPGAEAPAPLRERWPRLNRHVADFDTLFLTADPARRLDGWFADLTGPPSAPLTDISGGAWRALSCTREADWPPAHLQQERRKFRLETARGAFLLKFAGLGRDGREKARRAEALGAAGFVAAPLGFRHGFTLERWESARPADFAKMPREALVRRLAAYLGFRARHFAAPDAPGASLADLAAMLRHNGVEALGEAAARPLEQLCARLPAAAPRPVAIDGRLHAWEWLETADGRLLKADAVDHAAAHDLIGCQDIAWDIAGAAVELALSLHEVADLAARVARYAGHPADRALIAFLTPCYLAFQLGYYTMAAAANAGVADEATRLARRANFYRDQLAETLAERL